MVVKSPGCGKNIGGRHHDDGDADDDDDDDDDDHDDHDYCW